MNRRDFLATTTAAILAAPHIARAQDARTLRFAPQANLSSLDAVAGTQYVVRNASLLVWDTLFGVDHTITPKPQMVETYQNSPDFKDLDLQAPSRPEIPRRRARPLARRHRQPPALDGPRRHGPAHQGHHRRLPAPDDRTVSLKLSKPFPKMLFALGKQNAPVAEIMPERIAKTDPFKLITEYIGSGPMRFAKDEWVPGSKAIFTKFADYQPRPEKADWLAGGKRMNFDRIEWLIMPDDATKAGALQSGEIDWWENPIPDLVPLLKKNRNLNVDIADELGNIGSLRMNHLWPPFDDQRARRAVMMALAQEDYMRAVVGDDPRASGRSSPASSPPAPPVSTDRRRRHRRRPPRLRRRQEAPRRGRLQRREDRPPASPPTSASPRPKATSPPTSWPTSSA